MLPDSEKSYANEIGSGGLFDNKLIFGDNLLALKALSTEFLGQVRCIYIDPPYNTGAAFEQYDDGVEHSIWLSLIRDRLEILVSLLRSDGSIWISVDDNEAHYLKVVCDELLGRKCFIADIAWRKRDGAPNDRKIGAVHEHVLVYGRTHDSSSKKTVAELAFNLMQRSEKADAEYRIAREPFGVDERGAFRKVDLTANAKGGRFVSSLVYGLENPFTKELAFPRKGRCWAYSEKDMIKLNLERRIFWGIDGKATTPMRKLFKTEAKPGMTAPSIWDDVGLNQHASREMELLFGEKAAFETPKPEGLIYRILQIATNAGDIVLDSFAGSGTTGAVAHKMGRRWIMIELGPHCDSHIVPRLRKVIDGEDKGGITEAVGWQGGGGFRYFRLAPSLLEKDRWGNWVIARSYNAAMLAEAMCKHMGFTYAPSQDPAEYWRHGYSSERDFIFVTTANVTHDQLRAISEDVGPERTLLVCCKAFNARADTFENLTVKKIPQAVLSRCEWGRDDYSLRIAEAPPPPEDSASPATPEAAQPKRKRRVAAASIEPSLFSAMDAKAAGK